MISSKTRSDARWGTGAGAGGSDKLPGAFPMPYARCTAFRELLLDLGDVIERGGPLRLGLPADFPWVVAVFVHRHHHVTLLMTCTNPGALTAQATRRIKAHRIGVGHWVHRAGRCCDDAGALRPGYELQRRGVFEMHRPVSVETSICGSGQSRKRKPAGRAPRSWPAPGPGSASPLPRSREHRSAGLPPLLAARRS